MKNESISPEEKLFKIIQQEKNSSSAQGKPVRRKLSRISLKQIKEKLASLAQNSIEKVKVLLAGKSKELKLQTINKMLSVFLILLVLSALYYSVTKYPNAAKIMSATAKAQGSLQGAGSEIGQFEPASYYTGDAARRDIFTASHGADTSGAEMVLTDGGKGSSGDFKLQGIAWSDAPKVIIESGKDNKVYVVKEAQMIGQTGIKVKKILKNKVILTDGETDFEL